MANLISVELVVDKEKNRVLFAESDADFVDMLFSFLLLPMGTVVRLLGKKSGLDCFDRLYESVENLDTKYFQTEACRTMLLQPRIANEEKYEDLKIIIDDLEPRRIYRCPNWECYSKTHRLYSYVPGALCPCGQVFNKEIEIEMVDSSDIFLKGSAGRYMISEDLHVTPISTQATLSMLQKLGIKDGNNLEYRTVNVGKQQILNLLKGSLKSKAPLTDVLLRESDSIQCDNNNTECKPIEPSHIKVENGEEANGSKRICVRLLESKSKDKVVYAESGEDLVNQLFSFLTFPLGLIVKFLNKQSSLGSMDNLYHSVELLSNPFNCYFISEDCKNMLLSPKIATHFACSKQLLMIEEDTSTTSIHLGCERCFNKDKDFCSHGLEKVITTKINPKLPTPGTEHGGGFVKRSVKFMVTNEMVVAPFSSIASIKAITELEMPADSLTEREESCREEDVLNLLKACLTSCNVLSSVFSGKKRKRGEFA